MVDLQSLQLAPVTPVLDAMRIIGRGAAQIALVVDEQQRLLGTLTDGDIRRGLLHGETLEAPAERLMNRHFRFVRSGEDQAAVLETMRREVRSISRPPSRCSMSVSQTPFRAYLCRIR